MKKRRYIALLGIILVLALALTACGKPGETVETPAASTAVGTTAEAPLSNEEAYAKYLADLPDDSVYAFVNMGGAHDALLISTGYFEFEEDIEAYEAIIYGFDADGNIKSYGTVRSGGTANPLTEKDGALYYASHHSASKATIDESKSRLITETVDDEDADAFEVMFNDYMEGNIVMFTAES